MKKVFAWLMLLTAMSLFTVATAPVMADKTWHALYAGSPHYWTDKWSPMPVGSVAVWNDGDYLYVKYYTNATAGWYLTETHLAVVTDPELFPMTKKGNPKVGHFPYKHEGLDSTHDEYMIPLDGWTTDTVLYIAAHAVVEMRSDGCVLQEETAWANCGGEDAYFRGNNWATYFWYEVQ